MAKLYKLFFVIFLLSLSLEGSEYRYRQYLHVKDFYEPLAAKSVELALKYNIPPAALLAIAGVESGYGRGYVAKITGNILSLGARKGEAELPSLYLPNLKSDSSKILYAPLQIAKFKPEELVWKQRPKSLKKDYRPKNIAGKTKELDFFDKHPDLKLKANLSCLEDFAKEWISEKRKFLPFKEARAYLENEVAKNSKEILFSKEVNEKFLKLISGRKNSFNYRTTWAVKVLNIIKNAGLLELTQDLHVKKKSFQELW